MSDTSPTPAAAAAIPPVVLSAAMEMVTRYRLRLVDARDARLGELAGDQVLSLAAWTGPRAGLVLFYDPPADLSVAGPDLARRCEAARRWGAERLRLQGAQRCDILLVPLRPVPGSISAASGADPVNVSVVALDPDRGEVLPLLSGRTDTLPGARQLRQHLRAIQGGAPAPTLAAVDLAERNTVADGYVAPANRALNSMPIASYSLIGIFVLIWLIESQVATGQRPRLDSVGLGALIQWPAGSGVSNEWWRYVSYAFLHDPGSVLHVGFNCFAMFFAGRLAEQLYGRLVFLTVFIASAVGGGLLWTTVGALASSNSLQAGVTVGASGGICGLFGLLLVTGRVQGRNVPAGVVHVVQRYALQSLGLTLIVGFLMAGVINNWAHGGGAATGALLGLLFPPLHRLGGRDLKPWEIAVCVAVIGAAVVALGFAGVNAVQSLSTPQIR